MAVKKAIAKSKGPIRLAIFVASVISGISGGLLVTLSAAVDEALKTSIPTLGTISESANRPQAAPNMRGKRICSGLNVSTVKTQTIKATFSQTEVMPENS